MWWRTQSEKFYPFAVVQESPIQIDSSSLKPFPFKKYTIKPFAEFQMKGLVLSEHHYYWGRASELVPVDLALGWGPMSDGNILKEMSVSQMHRWYFFSYDKPLSISGREINTHSANMHLIPATPEIARKIKEVRKSNIVEFKGYLVDLTAPDGFFWNSSRSRDDTGDGACELVWVDEFDVVNP